MSSELDRLVKRGGFKFPNYWSLSRWDKYSKCKLMYFLACIARTWQQVGKKGRYVNVYPEAPSPKMEEGTRIHKLAEGYLRGEVKGIPREMEKFESEFKQLKALGAAPEDDWTITAEGEFTTGDDFRRAWLRSKTDAHLAVPPELSIIDYKTGGIRDYSETAELYSVVGAMKYPGPEIENIVTEFWFLLRPKQGSNVNPNVIEIPAKVARASMRKKWFSRAVKMLKDRDFKPSPSDEACKWCAFRSDRKLADGRPGPCGLHP